MPSQTVRSSQRGRSRRGVLLGAGAVAGTAIGARVGYEPALPENPREDLSLAEYDGRFDGKPSATDSLSPLGRVMGQTSTTRDGARIRDRLGNLAGCNSLIHQDCYPTRRWNDFITS